MVIIEMGPGAKSATPIQGIHGEKKVTQSAWSRLWLDMGTTSAMHLYFWKLHIWTLILQAGDIFPHISEVMNTMTK